MTDVKRLTEKVVQGFKANKTSSIFINGAPGSGCSFILDQLAQVLPVEIQRLYPLGPYTLGVREIDRLPELIATDLWEAGFASSDLKSDYPGGLHEAWKAFSSRVEVGQRQSFLVMVDLLETHLPGYIKPLASLFSAVRFLESRPFDHEFGLYHVISGFWNPILLGRHYEDLGVSFPYTVGENYHIWEGADEIGELWPLPGNEISTWESLLIEISGGHLGVLSELRSVLGESKITFDNVIRALDNIAQDGPSARSLVNLWGDFLPDIHAALQHLLANRVIHLNWSSQYQELMRAAGIAKLEKIGSRYFLGIKSWFIERVFAHHGEELGFDPKWVRDTLLDDPLPQLLSFNSCAYQLLNDVETKVRQFVSVCLRQSNTTEQHVLKRQVCREKRNGYEIEDAYQRATTWKAQSSDKGLHTQHNPLITYCTTTDLAELTRDIGIEQNRQEWIEVADLIDKLVPIRNAVMHNQLIDETTLELLFSLQEHIYSLLGNAS